MGHKNSKEKLGAIIGNTYTCPSCQQIFDSKTPAKEVNDHIINCSHSPTSLSSKDLYTPLSLNLNKKRNKTLSSKSVAKLNPFKIKDYIKTKKINWIEGCDTIEISRENCLEESMKEIKYVNLWREVKMPFLYEKTAPWTAPFRKGKMDEKTCLSERLCRGKGGKPAETGFVLTGDGRSPC